MPDWTPLQWLLVAFAAACIGFSKSGFVGVGMVAVLLMAQVMPARESTGTILPMLIVADLFAVRAFRRFAVWSHLVRLLPTAVLGVLTGFLIMPYIPDDSFGPVIGWIMMVLLGLMVVQRFTNRMAMTALEHPAVAWCTGWVAGVTTMIANAAGPVMGIYLLTARLPKWEFVGTGAWYFLIVNLVKVPFSASMGLITPSSLLLNLAATPVILAGIVIGRWLLGKINQAVFEWLMIVFVLLGALRLIV